MRSHNLILHHGYVTLLFVIVRIHGGGEQTESTSNPKVLRKYDSQVSMVSSALASLGGGSANTPEVSKMEMESKGEKKS